MLQKLDSFLDAKTHALGALDDANRVKNAAFGIDNTHSATSKFINDFVASKIQAATGSIGPVINGAQAFFATAKNGLTGAVASKLASLSSLSSGLSAGVAGKADVLSAGHGVGKMNRDGTEYERFDEFLFESLQLVYD